MPRAPYDPEKAKSHYLKNRAKILAQKKEYSKTTTENRKKEYAENRKERLAVNAKWRAEHKEYLAQYRLNNKEKRAESAKRYRKDNKDRIAARETEEKRQRRLLYLKEYQKKNAGELKRKAKEYRVKNHTKIAAMQLNWQRKNREKTRMKGREYNSKKKSASPKDTAVIAKWENSWRSKMMAVCFWCKKTVRTIGCHTDHIKPLSKNGLHKIENLCIACPPCNLRKSALLPEQWNLRLSEPVLL